MAGLSLKKGIRLNADTTGAVLIDTDLCRTARLTPQEATILTLCDGRRASEEILVESRKSHPVLDLAQVQEVLSHFVQEGFLYDPTELSDVEIDVDLGSDRPATNLKIDFEAPLLSDPAPRLRSDLLIQKKATGELGLVDVTDPRAGRTFSLYDFEVSIARMLNGDRKIVEVIEAAAKIGIPVTLESFQKFIRQIRAYGFIEEANRSAEPPPTEAPTTWEPRQEWSAEVRQLFQSALKMFRLKRFEEAKNYVDAILAIDAQNVEAGEMLKRIEAGLNSLEAVVTAAEASTEAVNPAPNFEDLYGAAAAAKDQTQPRDYRTRTAERPAHRMERLRSRLIAAAVILAALVAVGFYPFPHVLRVEAKVQPIQVVSLRAPRDGTIRALFVHERQWVTAGTKLLELDTRVALQRLEMAEQNFQKASEELQNFEARKQSAGFVKLRTSAEALREELEKLKTDRDGLTSKRQAAKKLRLSKRIKSVEASLRRSEEEIERTAPATKEPELRLAIQGATQEKEQLKKEIESATVVASHEGIVIGLPEAKTDISTGQLIGRIEDIGSLRATLRVADSDAHLIQNHQLVSLSAPNLPRQEFKGRISLVPDVDQTDGNFEAIVKNPEKLTLDPVGKVTIQCGKQSFGQRLVNRVKRLTVPSLHAALR